MTYLFESLIALAAGPALHFFGRRWAGFTAAFDAFFLMTLAGLVLFFILPEIYPAGGFWVIVCFVVGFLLPGWLEFGRHQHHHSRLHRGAIVLGVAGLALHVLLDGIALGAAGDGHFQASGEFAWAIILHRFPMGIIIWMLARPFGLLGRILALGLVMGVTVGGYFFGGQLTGLLELPVLALFQAFVLGGIAHVILHRSPAGNQSSPPSSAGLRRWAGSGAVMGIGLLCGLAFLNGAANPGYYLNDFLNAFAELLAESAPALLAGYFIAGQLHIFFPESAHLWLSKGRPSGQALRGMAFGLPLPVCSCGVVPLYQSMVSRGVPAPAALAFLVATPEIGLDAVLLSIPLLGTEFTLVRLAAAALVAWLVGTWVSRFFVKPAMASALSTESHDDCCTPAQPPKGDSAGVGSTQSIDPGPGLAEGQGQDLAKGGHHHDHEHGGHEHVGPGSTLAQRFMAGLRAGFGEILDHTAPWILVGLFIAALFQVWFGAGFFLNALGPYDVIVFALAGIPLYICASGTTPFVAILLLKGASPGAALALLLTGPATNVTTFGVLSALHGRRAAIIFGAAMFSAAVGLGYSLNLVWPAEWSNWYSGEHGHSVLSKVWLGALLGVFVLSLFRQGPRRFWAGLLPGRSLGTA